MARPASNSSVATPLPLAPAAGDPRAVPARRIAFAFEHDADDLRVQSGRPYYLRRALVARGCEVIPVFPLDAGHHVDWKSTFYGWRGLKYYTDREPRVLRGWARQIERELRRRAADMVILPSSRALTELDLPMPKVLIADATFANVLDFYEAYTRCAAEYVRKGHAQERKALANCSLAIYPSEWAARSAREVYGASPHKVHVVPFGANVRALSAARVLGWIDARPVDHLQLLFVGRDWKRKGGEVVIDTCEILRREGVSVSVDLVGLSDEQLRLPGFVRHHGLLDKRRAGERRRLTALYAAAHFLFVPSLAENFGLVYPEAAAHGVPSLAREVGGVAGAVVEGRSGHVLPAGAPAAAYAEILLRYHADPQRYRELARTALDQARTRFNWGAFVERLTQLTRQFV